MLLRVTWTSGAAAIFRMTSLVDLNKFSVTRLAPHHNPHLSAENWEKTSSPQKSASLQSLINRALFTLLHVICVIQIMSAIQLYTFSQWAYKPPQRKPIPHPKKSAKENLILSSLDRLTPFKQNSLFKRTFHHLLSYLVFRHFYQILFWLDNDVSQTLSKTFNMMLLQNISLQLFIVKCFKNHFFSNNKNIIIIIIIIIIITITIIL